MTSYITTFVTGFESDEYIHSTLEVTVYSGMPTDQILLECSIDDLGGSEAIIVSVNTSKYIKILARSQ